MTATNEEKHLVRLDAILDALRTNPLAPHMRIFGSALTKDVPGDIDCFLEGPFGLDAETRNAAMDDYLLLAVKGGYAGNYGSFDPFVLNGKGVLYTRSEHDTAFALQWVRARSAKSLIAAGRAGVPLLEFDRRFSHPEAVTRPR